jgi:pimeloyl-ACP methyl ester carboxylesterase
MLLVGIDNTAARMDEYTHTEDDIESGPGGVYGGLGDAYGELLQETIRPFIQERFGEPEKPGLMGSSLGGLISLYLAYHFPGEYQFSASLSGTVGWGSIGLNNPTIIELMEQAGHQSTAIYLDSGGGGDCYDSDGDGIDDDNPLVGDNYCENLQLRDTLVSVGYQFEVDLWHWWEPEAEHNETAWAARAGMPMEIFAGL